MKLKHNLILLIVLILFASVILLFERPFEDKAKKTREEAPPLFPPFKVEQVKKIVVKKNNTITTLEKRDNLWYVLDKEDFPADPTIVEGVIKKIQGFKKINLASRKKDKQSLFEVKEGMGVEVTLVGPKKKELAHFFVGKVGPGFLSTYLRKANSDDVYLYDDYLKGDFDKPVNNWRDRTIFAFNPNEVVALTISKLKKEKETIVLIKDNQGKWQLEEPISGLAENQPIEKILTTLGNLKTTDFADEEKELKDSGIDDPTYKVMVKLKDNRKKTLVVGNTKESQYYVKNNEKKYLFLLDHNIVESLVPKVKDLQKAKIESEKKEPPEKAKPSPQALPRDKF